MDQGLGENIFKKPENNVTFKVEGSEDGMGYLCDNKDSKIGLIVLQEWWGLNQNMINLCDKFSKEGFKAICVDIYRGKISKDMESANHLMSKLDWPSALKDIAGARNYLKENGCTKVAVTGYCMGGALTLAAVINQEGYDCAIPFYGTPDLSQNHVKNIKCPVLAMYGEHDDAKGFSDVETAKKLESAFKEANLPNTSVKIWPGTGHAFMNVDSKLKYNEETAKLAFAETVEFVKKHCS